MASANATGVPQNKMGLVIAASTTGTAIEWYDFFLYGTASAVVLPHVFFPELNGFIGLLLSLFTFLVGFIARPIGGALFGHYGDRIGRKSTLVATLLVMGIGTFLVGILPGYATIGLAAPIILFILRFAQGLGVGGEWGGSVLLAMEYGHKRNRGFWAAWPQMGVPIGLIIESLIFNAVTNSAGSATKLADGNLWRVPFLLSAVLVVVGLFIRLRILETPLFQQVKDQGKVVAAPIAEAFKKSTPEILLSAGARFVEQAPFYLFTTFVISYAIDKEGTGLNYVHPSMTATTVLNAIIIGGLIELGTIPLFGYLSDIVGRRTWYLIGCVLMAAFAFPYFMLLNQGGGTAIIAIAASICIFHAWVYGPQAALIAERFGTKSRYSGASLGYQLAAPFAGGLAPIIALLLAAGATNLKGTVGVDTKISIGAGSWQAVSIYIIVLAAISFVSVIGLKELSKADISGADEVVLAPLTAQD